MKARGWSFLFLPFLLGACTPVERSSKVELPSSEESLAPSFHLSINKNTITLNEKAYLSLSFTPIGYQEEVSFELSEPIASLNKASLEVTPLKEGNLVITAFTASGLRDAVALEIIKGSLTMEVTFDEMLDSLKTPYLEEKTTKTDLGLKDTAKVGVGKEKLENEVRYPVPTEGITEIFAKSLGITPEGTQNSQLLNAYLKTLEGKEETTVIRFEDGRYEFAYTIEMTGLANVYLAGTGKTLFALKTWSTYLRASSSKNIHINDINFDIDPAPTIWGTILSFDESNASRPKITLSISETFDLDNEFYRDWNTHKRGSYEEYTVDEKGQIIPDMTGNLFYNPGIESIALRPEAHEMDIILRTDFAYWGYRSPKVGATAAFAFQVYENHGFHFLNCENTYMENVTAYTSGGMGLRADSGKNLYLNRVNYVRNAEDGRLITCTADIFHTCNLDGEAIISNCVLEGSHDDGINVKSFYCSIQSIKRNVLTVNQTQSEVVISFEKGDTIDIYNQDGCKLMKELVVQDVKQYGTNFELTVDQRLPSTGSNSYLGFLVANATKQAKVTLENSIIRNKRNRGYLLQSRHSKVLNCTFENITMGALKVIGATENRFKEAIIPSDIEVKNSKFLNCYETLEVISTDNAGKSTSGTLKRVNISNCFFYANNGYSTNTRGAGEVTYEDNFFYEKDSMGYSNSVTYSQNITFRNNGVYADHLLSNYRFVVTGEEVANVKQEDNFQVQGGTL